MTVGSGFQRQSNPETYGGPVIDDNGYVAGVLNRGGAQNLNSAITGSAARDFPSRRTNANEGRGSQRGEAASAPPIAGKFPHYPLKHSNNPVATG